MNSLRSFHLGAGRQSTTIALLVAEGVLPKPDVALFSDTHREPGAVYRHLDRVERELLVPAGVPLRRVSHGDLGADVLSPHAFATIPAYTLELTPAVRGFVSWNEQKPGRQKRHCTGRYKIEPLQREERILLGARVRHVSCSYCEATGTRMAPWNAKLLAELGMDVDAEGDEWTGPGRCSVCRGTAVRVLVDEVPLGALAEVWIGYDASEAAMRINDNKFAAYQRPAYPLLDLPRPAERIKEDRRRMRRHAEVGWTLNDCLWYLAENGWHDVPKSSCYMCPNAANPRWRQLRDTCDCGHHRDSHRQGAWACQIYRAGQQCACANFKASDWEKAVAYDRQFRSAPGMRALRFLHEDRVPLGEANLERPTAAELRRAQLDIFDGLYGADEIAPEDFGGCSPHGCHEDPVFVPEGDVSDRIVGDRERDPQIINEGTERA